MCTEHALHGKNLYPSAANACLLAAGEECYLAIDKGAINDHHVLLVPIEHYPSTLTCSPNFHAEMERYLSALRSCFAAQVRGCPGTSCLPQDAALWHRQGTDRTQLVLSEQPVLPGSSGSDVGLPACCGACITAQVRCWLCTACSTSQQL